MAEEQSCVPAWNPAEADRLLAELRAEVDRLRQADFRGRFPEPLATVVNDYLELGQQYIEQHEQEAARGWDALALLQEAKARVVQTIRRVKQERRQAG